MKRTVKIKNNIYRSPIDLGEVLSSRRACGIRLDLYDCDFIELESRKIVLFDPYATTHKYEPLPLDTGSTIGFPFCLCCMTDGGERIAYAGIKFAGADEPVDWHIVAKDVELARLAIDPDAAAVPIMSGVCMMSSETAYEEYISHIKDERHPLAGLIVLNGETHETVRLFGHKYAVFSSGRGDGGYRCYAGRDKSGKLAAVVCDLDMIAIPTAHGKKNHETYTEVEIDVPDDVYEYDPNKSESENNIAKWTKTLSIETDHAIRANAFSRRGYAYHSLGEYDKALADYESAIGESKASGDGKNVALAWSVYDNAAEIYRQKSDLYSAIRITEEAINSGDEFYSGAYVRLIDLYLLTKHTDKAMEIAERMLKKRYDDPVADMKYAEACVSAMEYRKAAETYERLAEKFSLYDNYFDEASCFIALGEYAAADAALERYPSKRYNEQYWYYKAFIAYRTRRFDTALKLARYSHSIDQEFMPALYLLIDVFSIMRDYHAVARYAEEYKKLRPDNEYGYSVCAEAQLILGNFSECLQNYYYLYENFKHDDRIAALVVLFASRTGESRIKNKLLKELKKKRSPYCAVVMYAIYVSKYKSDDDFDKDPLSELKFDDEFLLQLSIFFNAAGNVDAAERVLDILLKKSEPTYELWAQKIRIAEKRGDKSVDALIDRYSRMFLV